MASPGKVWAESGVRELLASGRGWGWGVWSSEAGRVERARWRQGRKPVKLSSGWRVGVRP